MQAAGYRTLCYDLVGRGLSSAPDGCRYDWEAHTQQLEVLLEELQVHCTPHVVVAHSMGGIIATLHAARSSHCLGAALLAPAGAMAPPIPGFQLLQRLLGCWPVSVCVLPVLSWVLNAPPPEGESWEVDPEPVDRAYMERARHMDVWDSDWLLANRASNGARPLAESIVRMPFCDVLRCVRQHQPEGGQEKHVLLITGKDDPIIRDVDVSVYRELFGAGNVSVRQHRGKHCFFLQDPEPVHRCVLAWLWRVSESV
eukprot:TRINITY_DN3037_c0_g1_i1.p1 TRINITY_DN3037_c0_g1~~TRINITY_DN3037_c0_g1_i1.p1  ORF type:complete len:255 (+),score=30.53 TRINITY_DN3037_c0_g1_i1:357-1121(+)